MIAMMTLIEKETDKEKFDRLYNTYKDMMFKIANSILRNPALAEETVQDCLFKLAITITEVPDIPSKRARAMIITMTKNKARNNLKLEHYDDIAAAEDDDFISDRLADSIASTIGFKRFLQELRELDAVYRDILIMKYIHGFSANEISEILQIPRRTVETRIYRGRQILKEKLESAFYEYGV